MSTHEPRVRGVGWVLRQVVKAVATIAVVGIPAIGVWAGSSIASFQNGPIWAAVLAGLLMFPLLPLGWDALSELRRRRRAARSKGTARPRVLTFWDRLIVRTFVLSSTFLLVFVLAWPSTIFTALSTRGDWMLDGRHGPTAEWLRGALLSTADGLAFLYEASEDNPFERWQTDDELPSPTPTPTPGIRARTTPQKRAPTGTDSATPEVRPDRTQPDQPEPEAGEPEPEPEPEGELTWPLRASLHPAVVAIPASARTSPATVARWLVSQEPDPFLRVKALHDFVTDHVAYDAPAYASGDYPPQDADTVFRTGRGVCAGYARLLVAMGEAVGVQIVYLVGSVRHGSEELGGVSHAWNAVEIEDGWYLVDATWDAGSVSGSEFEKRYSTDYLLTPPHVFGLDHFPEDPRWQLRERPLERGEFNRQPAMRPRFYAHGLDLVEPRRSQVTVSGQVRIVVDNPHGQHLMASYHPKRSPDRRTRCNVDGSRRVELSCAFPRSDVYEVVLYDSPTQYGQYWGVGSIEVVNR
jgi:transglutaminase-like putative cysteine protease